MAFPGTFNINYYKGDTFEFRVYPKDSAGNVFDLTDFSNEDIKFSISTARGVTPTIEAYAVKAEDNSYIACAILPGNGAEMTAGTTYVYDIEISREASPYDIVFTLMTGTITVTDQITGA